MQRSAGTPAQPAAPFFSSIFGFGGGTNSSTSSSNNISQNTPPSPTSKTQLPTSSGEDVPSENPRQHKTLVKERKPSIGRKSSFVFLSSSPGKKTRRRADSAASSNLASPVDGGGAAVPIPPRRPSAIKLAPEEPVPPLPDISPKTTDGFSKMLSRGAPTPTTGYPVGTAGSGAMHNTHEGRIYWFNTLLFDKPDLQRMPYFDPRKLGRRATNYLLLGISLPAVIDLNSSTPVEFLRSLNTLLAEFDTFQQIHTENGIAASSLTRTRIPQMFRRAAAPVSKGPGPTPADAPPAGVISFGASEVDLLPGEEYTHLLTPTLPFDPDFFETFATLCDVLIDTYARLLSLLPTPRECGGAVPELFAKADTKIKKLFIQGAIREFEEAGRAGIKGEVASVGKVVLRREKERRMVVTPPKERLLAFGRLVGAWKIS
ncbi:hypothetical protein MYCTH_2117572 [Thermothelomyces thermophilus ATCC 42464]|uniref:Uncharacterized protein n=1 Tax=Thermothelomyces thermophilus (strain ATCC 42464 / BCRC 31852 / DSM 1799) TaxID=573729 RepID=G2Q847_THET4|nr:uncharacterized protein MYCTH_2117572 [Thermothelomyces thermophilus ATCC 42464]AEO57004.1 hypothetical protein MYCTH_2117572 [Thermothelomyces thermophilus ATCC 42464]